MKLSEIIIQIGDAFDEKTRSFKSTDDAKFIWHEAIHAINKCRKQIELYEKRGQIINF